MELGWLGLWGHWGWEPGLMPGFDKWRDLERHAKPGEAQSDPC